KAIQPVGQDVGSRVEVEMRAGANHFVFAKTYNRSKQTTLDILAPEKQQLTGRDAHEVANRILEESVDMALWEALLVDQGDKVGLVNLQSSSSLAHALDEAAGVGADAGPTSSNENSLFAATEKEYGEYFTPKTGQPRPGFATLKKDYETARSALAQARARLLEVEETVAAHTQQGAEVQRLHEAFPGLQQDLQNFEREWQRVQKLEDEVRSGRQTQSAAAELLQEAERSLSERRRLQESIAAAEQLARIAADARVPLQAQFDLAHAALTESQTLCAQQRSELRAAEGARELAGADVEYHQNQQELARLGKLLTLVEDINAKLVGLGEQRAELLVDDAALEQVRAADAALRLALGTRNAAATSVTVTARRPLTLDVDEAQVSLGTTESTTHSVAAAMTLHIPDVASIKIEPSHSVAELAEQVAQAEQALATLCQRFAVSELSDAVVVNARLNATGVSIEQLTARRSDALQGAEFEALLQSQRTLQSRCERYAVQRHVSTPLPSDLAQAQQRFDASRGEYQAAHKQLSETENALQTLQADAARLDDEVRKADVNSAKCNAALDEQTAAVELARAERDDAALQAEQQRRLDVAQQRRDALQVLENSLQEAKPEAVKALRDNAEAVFARAGRDLAAAEKTLASLSGQLVAAQADGRYEALDAEEQKATALADELAVIEGRAAAAQRLWTTLNKHRNVTRRAYVEPLKAAIEALGAIVFGSGFEVEVSEDWSIARRTLAGQTLSFADLSVGAREQLGILMRLASAQLVSRDGGVPLIIDDALGFSDPGRLQTMGAAIAAAGEHCQIIILTCTPGRFTHVGNAQVVRLSADP
ncbi:MAG: hypothetical protein ACR2PZ_15780, partial [Pseudomonadales bacterium]